MLDLGEQPAEAHEGDLEADEEELEESIEAAEQHKRMLAERNASLQNKVHQVWWLSVCPHAFSISNLGFTSLA